MEEILFGNSSNKVEEKLDFRSKTEFLVNQPAKLNGFENDSTSYLETMNKSYEIVFTKNNEE